MEKLLDIFFSKRDVDGSAEHYRRVSACTQLELIKYSDDHQIKSDNIPPEALRLLEEITDAYVECTEATEKICNEIMSQSKNGFVDVYIFYNHIYFVIMCMMPQGDKIQKLAEILKESHGVNPDITAFLVVVHAKNRFLEKTDKFYAVGDKIYARKDDCAQEDAEMAMFSDLPDDDRSPPPTRTIQEALDEAIARRKKIRGGE